MNLDTIITLAIGILAASYVGAMMRRSARNLLAPAKGGSACGGCSGCGTPKGHADSEESCAVHKNDLVVLEIKHRG